MQMIRRNGPRSLLDEVLSEPFFAIAPFRSVHESPAPTLAVDVSENDQAVFVRASVPGFDKDAVQVEVHDGVVTIRASRSDEKDEHEGERFYRRERRVVSMERSLTLPVPVQEEKAQASLKDGVLTLTLPKNQKVMPRRIAVN